MACPCSGKAHGGREVYTFTQLQARGDAAHLVLPLLDQVQQQHWVWDVAMLVCVKRREVKLARECLGTGSGTCGCEQRARDATGTSAQSKDVPPSP